MMSCDRGLLEHSHEGRLHLGEPGPGTRYHCCRAGLAGCGMAPTVISARADRSVEAHEGVDASLW
jgi:hypothetical protein